MECSVVAARSMFRQIKVRHFFYGIGLLATEAWQQRSLSNAAALDAKAVVADLAVDFAVFWLDQMASK